MKKPLEIKNPDFSELIEAVKEYIEFLNDEDAHEDGLDNYQNDIFEKATEAIFGSNVFDYVNHKVDNFS